MARCSVCGHEDLTVDRNLFDGMCASCTNLSLYHDDISDRAKRNNEVLRELAKRSGL